MHNAMHRPFLSGVPSIDDMRSCADLAAQLLLAEFLSPEFERTGKPWRQRWSVPCNKCFQLTQHYHDSSQISRCQECINIFDKMDLNSTREAEA